MIEDASIPNQLSGSTLMEYYTEEARDQALATGVTDGMEMSYSLLDAVLREG